MKRHAYATFCKTILVAGGLLAILVTSACTMGPYDKQRVQQTDEKLQFWGFYILPSVPIEIESYDATTNSWGVLAKAQSSSVPLAVSHEGQEMYIWNKFSTIPDKYWNAGITGKRSLVRATGGGFNLISVREGAGNCYFDSTGLIDFASRCSAPESPLARIFTEDYAGVDAGCTAEAGKLVRLVNEYRAQNGLSKIPLSPSLCAVGQAHAVDLSRNRSSFGNQCNLHSWSSNGEWSPCCYTDDHAQAACMWKKPGELTSYKGYGYENAHAGSPTPEGALNSWKNSTGHNEVILNRGQWANNKWKALGAGSYRNYWVLWFGEESDPAVK